MSNRFKALVAAIAVAAASLYSPSTETAVGLVTSTGDSDLDYVGGYHEPFNFTSHWDFMMNDCGPNLTALEYDDELVDTYIGEGTYHAALDMNADGAPDYTDSGDTVYAIADGTVYYNSDADPHAGLFGGLGDVVYITHRAADDTAFNAGYGHINVDLPADRNTGLNGHQVNRGDPIGTLASASWSHLHFTINSSTTSASGGTFDCDSWPSKGTFQDPDVFLAAHPADEDSTEEPASYDAGPSIALTEDNTVAVNNTERSTGNNRTLLSAATTLNFSTNVSTGSVGSGWATGGTADLANDPSQDDTVWLAALKETASAHGKLYVYEIENDNDTQRAQLTVGAEDDQWSLDAPPSIIVDGDGNVYVAAVQVDGDMSMFKINGSTYNVGRVDIGNAGAWSTTGTVSLALAPDDSVWLAAVTKESISEVRTYKGTPHTLTFSGYGTVGVDGWTVNAAPGIVVDNDGNVTVVAIKAQTDGTGVMWSYHNDDGSSGNWVKINDDVGASSLEWSNDATPNLATDSSGKVYVTGIRDPDTDGGQLQVLTMTPASTVASSTWSGIAGSDGLGAYTDWSKHAGPDIVIIQGTGSVFVVGVKVSGEMYAFKRTAGSWSGATQIGTGSGWTGNQP